MKCVLAYYQYLRWRLTPATPRHPSPLLPLLPSGPDGVHSLSSRGDRCKSPLAKISTLPDERDKWGAYYQGLFLMTNACQLFLWARSTVNTIINQTVHKIDTKLTINNQQLSNKVIDHAESRSTWPKSTQSNRRDAFHPSLQNTARLLSVKTHKPPNNQLI